MKDICNIKSPKQSLKNILSTQELNNKHNINLYAHNKETFIATVVRQFSHNANVYYRLEKT